MALNYPGPYQVRIFYESAGRQHVLRLNCALDTVPNPGDPFMGIMAITQNGTLTDLESEVDAFAAIMQGFLNSNSATIDYAELWKFEPNSFDASFVSALPIGLPGTVAAPTVLAGQYIFTFRTQEGGVMKVSIMESIFPVKASETYAQLFPVPKLLVDHVIGLGSIWLGRDTSYPFNFMRAHPGINEQLFKKIYRQ